MSMIGITTVVYNKLEFCKEAIEAVLNKTERPFFYVLVYNASPYPGVKEYIQSLEDKVDKIIYNDTNMGVSYTYFQGYQECKQASVDYYVKIDDDTILQTPNWNSIMLDAFNRFEKLGVLSADLDMGKQTGPFTVSMNGPLEIEEYENPCVGGAATMYPMSLFESIGFFADFGLYAHEDGEFAHRAKQAKYRTAYIRQVKAKHLARTDKADKAFDSWKIAVHFSQEKRDYPTWLREEFNKEVKEVLRCQEHGEKPELIQLPSQPARQ